MIELEHKECLNSSSQFVYNPSYVNFFKNLKAEFIDEFLSLCLVESLQQLFNFFPSKFQFKNYAFLTWYSAGCVWEITYEDVKFFKSHYSILFISLRICPFGLITTWCLKKEEMHFHKNPRWVNRICLHTGELLLVLMYYIPWEKHIAKW